MMRAGLLLLVLFLGVTRGAQAIPLETVVAEQQLSSALMSSSATGSPQPSPNPLQKISLNAILAARGDGYSNKDFYERSGKANDPRLPQLNAPGYTLSPNVVNALSPTNNLVAKATPPPESAADLQRRFEDEDAARKAKQKIKEVNYQQDMARIYEQSMKAQAKARKIEQMKAAEGTP